MYRKTTLPYASVVLTDGSSTLNNDTGVFDLTISGFDQALEKPAENKATITYIVADGQKDFPEILYFNGATAPYRIGNNPNNFRGAKGSSWDNLTLPVSIPRPMRHR